MKTHFIALIHKEPDSGYGVSFPDVPGVIAAADTLDEALREGRVQVVSDEEKRPPKNVRLHFGATSQK